MWSHTCSSWFLDASVLPCWFARWRLVRCWLGLWREPSEGACAVASVYAFLNVPLWRYRRKPVLGSAILRRHLLAQTVQLGAGVWGS
eukprot:13525125-Alexandrium_andersonii.AAC.1